MNYSNISNLTKQDELNELYVLNWVNYYVNDIIGSILFIFGILFNILSFVYFQLSKSFRDTSMRHYFSVLSISDSLRLSEWLFTILMDKKIIFLNSNLCRAFLFITITNSHISVWLLVFLSIERYIILQFPFRGKQFYTTKNSLILLCVVIVIIVLFDIPYLMPNFVQKQFIDYDLHLYMCITNSEYRMYMFINNILFYSIVPFVILLIFNGLLISLLARQKMQLFSIIQSDQNSTLNAKRDRQFKERTILLMLVTFFLVLTVSPRYIVQMIFMFVSYQGIHKVTIIKCLSILEMLNFSLNFFFYIICSKTSRTELYLMLYYLFYWKWSAESKHTVICNHPNHNRNVKVQNVTSLTNKSSFQAQTNDMSTTQYETNLNLYNMGKYKSKLKIHCFLINATRIRNKANRRPSLAGTSANGNHHQTVFHAQSNNKESLMSSNFELHKNSSCRTNSSYNKQTLLSDCSIMS